MMEEVDGGFDGRHERVWLEVFVTCDTVGGGEWEGVKLKKGSKNVVGSCTVWEQREVGFCWKGHHANDEPRICLLLPWKLTPTGPTLIMILVLV